jgi:predicted DCC family thiol-disulfide oxidoreductase YuxK
MESNTNTTFILYDGMCLLCDKFILFIKRADKKSIFRFEAYQGEFGSKYRDMMKMDGYGTVGLIYNDKILVKSKAALTILKMLGFPWNLAYVFILIPEFLRDGIYKWVAKNRYMMFGKKEYCD